MEYTSWMETQREQEGWRSDEELAKLKEEALRDKEAWPDSVRFSYSEENMLYAFSELGMEKEFFEIGEAIIGKYPDPADDWYLADTVYSRYAYHFLINKKPKEALDWYMKSLENNLPYPQSDWKEIAACYVELKDVENADIWIEKCMEHDKSKGNDGWLEWVDYAAYFNSTNRPERALALCLRVLEVHKYPPMEIWGVMANAYKLMGDYKKAIDTLQAYVDKFKYDEDGYIELANLVYEHEKDVPRVESLLLQAIEQVKEKPEYRSWVSSVYHNIAVVHLNEGYWDKAFIYLNSYFEWKYPPDEFEFFRQMIAQIPAIESEGMAIDLYHILVNFETSALRPGNKLQVDEGAFEQPTAEVKDANFREFDISKLTDLDGTQSN